MTSIDPHTLPTAAKGERSSMADDSPRRPLEQCRGDDLDMGSSDTSEKRKRSRKLKQARRGKRPEREADGTNTAEPSSDEDWEHHESPTDGGVVVAKVISQDSKPFSYTGELLPQYDAECLLGAHHTEPAESGSATVMPPVLTTRGSHYVNLPHPKLEPLEKSQVYDIQSHSSDVGDDFEAQKRRPEGSSWVPANHIVGEPKVDERSTKPDNSEGERLVEPHSLPDAPGNNDGLQAVHGEAVERPIIETAGSPTRRAIRPCTLGSEVETAGPSQHSLEDFTQRGSRASEQPIAEQSQEPTGISRQHAVHESDNQAAGPTGESSDVFFQNWLHHPNNRADDLLRRTSDVTIQRTLGSCGQQAVEPAPHSSKVPSESGLGESPLTAVESSRQSLDASISRLSEPSFSSSTVQRLKVAIWITRVGPVRRFICELHEGYSARENYGVGPNVHWRPRTTEGPLFDWAWSPTHPPGARRWSIGQKSDGYVVGVHIGVHELGPLSRGIYDRRTKRDEMRLVVEANQDRDISQKGTESFDGCDDPSSQDARKRRWRFRKIVRCCLKNIWMALCQCCFPSAAPENDLIALNQVDRPNRPNRQSTAANTDTSLTARDEKSEGSGSNRTLLGSSPRQVSRS